MLMRFQSCLILKTWNSFKKNGEKSNCSEQEFDAQLLDYKLFRIIICNIRNVFASSKKIIPRVVSFRLISGRLFPQHFTLRWASKKLRDSWGVGVKNGISNTAVFD